MFLHFSLRKLIVHIIEVVGDLLEDVDRLQGSCEYKSILDDELWGFLAHRFGHAAFEAALLLLYGLAPEYEDCFR